MNEVRHSRRVTTELFARFEIGRRPKSIGVENGVVTPWEPREVTYAPKLHVPDPLFPPITTALGSQTRCTAVRRKPYGFRGGVTY